MFEKIIAFFMSIISFILGLFGLSFGDGDGDSGHIENTNAIVFEDLSYGTHERNVLDLALPKTTDGETGLVLFIHGGAWIGGDKDGYNGGVSHCANSMGLAGAAINYRYLSDDVSLHEIIDDIDAALVKIKATAAENGVNINKVLLTGSSAGAHLSMLYAYKCKNTAPIKPAAVFSYCGPTDLYDDNFYYNNAMGNTEYVCQLLSLACGQDFTIATKADAKAALDTVSPLYYVDSDICPTAICHGQKDSIVPYSNATSIVAAFEQNGVDYDFISYPNSDHDLGSDPACAQQANDLLFEYARTYLK